ncbi:hypothetical protein J8TS2_28000 [Lederbergia ruris]|uniref:Uncharacterized protein n=1 Tax=Lederbergia ruris TaxID=217495 RepID=A0ABQ4KLY3_9BACI|nr:hypothetical protein J8TS2_28000 [Lederbergia ruris]
MGAFLFGIFMIPLVAVLFPILHVWLYGWDSIKNDIKKEPQETAISQVQLEK